MGDNRNYAALDWVVGEIDETLKQARQTLEAYVENPQDSTRIRFCLTHIHQVHGSLQMVEFFGAALLAEEMEALAQALMNGNVSNEAEAQEVLMRSILQLPIYLEQVKSSRNDDPATILPLLNDLRAVRNASLLTESRFFSPNLSAAHEISGQPIPATQNPEQFKAVVTKLRQMYQYAAAGVIRSVNTDENIAYLNKVFSRLHQLTQGTARQPLWDVALALVEGLANDGIDVNVSVKSLLRQLDKEIKVLIDRGSAALAEFTHDELIKNLLYYVASSSENEPRIERLRIQYGLQQAEDYQPAGDLIAAPDPETMRTVVAALNDELEAIKLALDVGISGAEHSDTQDALPIMRRVADTLAVLGVGDLRKQILLQVDSLEMAIAEGEDGEPDNDTLMDVAGEIIAIEQRLAVIASGATATEDHTAEEQLEIGLAQETVLREARNGLEQAKDAIIEYIASQWDREHLNNVPTLLAEIRGGLAMVPLPRPAAILQACSDFIDEQLLKSDAAPEWSTLDTLADAIASVEYYLERLCGDREEEDELLLGVAEESIEALGYRVKVGAPTERVEPKAATSHEQANAETVLEKIADVESVDMDVLPEVEESDSSIGLEVEQSVPEVVIESEAAEDIEGVDAQALPEATVSLADEESDIDDEIIEIFIEEAGEVLQTIADFFPQWSEDFGNSEALTEIRRAYHTLKGSGRMVEANEIGELAWSVENMINRVIDGSIKPGEEHSNFISSVNALLPEMVAAFEARKANPQAELATKYQGWGEALAAGNIPAELSSLDSTIDDDDDGTDDNAVLWEIFGSEALTHLSVVEEFIAEMQASAPIYTPPSDNMQRALHTLKGSAHMADVTDIAALATPLERFVKELRTYQVNIDEDILQLICDGVSYTKLALEQIKAGETIKIEKLDQFYARIAELKDRSVGPLIRQKEAQITGQKKVDPELLSIFMAEEMNLLLDADQLLAEWQQDFTNTTILAPLASELTTLATGAQHANLPPMAGLSDQLGQLYEALDEQHITGDEELVSTLLVGHEALLDLVDAVAAGQNVEPVDATVQAQIDSSLAAIAAEADNSADEPQASSDVDAFVNDVIADSIAEDAVNEVTVNENTAEDISLIDAEPLDTDIAESFIDAVAEDEQALGKEVVDTADTDFVADIVAEIEVIEDAEIDLADEASTAEVIDVTTAVEDSSDDDDDDDDDELDPEILEIFIEEADELLEDIEQAVHEWEEDWAHVESGESLKRSLHTLKGGARLAGVMALGDIAHDFETFLISTGENAELNKAFFQQVNAYQDGILKGIDTVKAVAAGEGHLADICSEISEETTPVQANGSSSEAAQESASDADSASTNLAVASGSIADILPFTPKAKDQDKVDTDQEVGSGTNVSAPQTLPASVDTTMSPVAAAQAQQPTHLAARRSGPQEVVKVSAELLEELVNLAGETSISRGQVEEQVSELGFTLDEMDSTIHRLQEQLRRLDIETEAQVLFRQEQMMEDDSFDPLEMDRYSQLQQLSRSLIESASDLLDLKSTLGDKTRDTETLLLQQSRINTELQEGLMRSRMVPFSRLVPRLRRIVRQVSNELGKQVSFELDNIEGELDRSVLERMVAPLEHMLRNAVDHGIESREQRLATDKPETGRIVLSLGREGGDVILRLVDDGQGINLQRVREKAVERGLMSADAKLSDRDVMQFILHAGFSTADKVSQISGRGVGMDVVHSEIKQLGGLMSIDSRWGEGTEFVIRLPFTVSVNRALMVRIGDDPYAIPLNNIEGIVRVSPFELEHYYQDEHARFEYAGEQYQVRYLGKLLNSNARPKLEGQSMPMPVVLVRTAEHAVAMQVDQLMGSREIVVKSLGQQFSAVVGVSGATVMGDGSVVVILDPHAMIRREAALTHDSTTLLEGTGIQVEEDVSKTIMVVDDSVTVRKVTTRFLEREGYNVITAKDGVDALRVLQDHIPDAMLLDIEMPRMDGFEVAKNVRSSSLLKDVPIIMITSRTGEKHREHALSLGVNKYMGKPFQEDQLLRNIRIITGEDSADFDEADEQTD
jgi:chemosensory pili system protein ChpA (sensor histidine kinase/response regulator)